MVITMGISANFGLFDNKTVFFVDYTTDYDGNAIRGRLLDEMCVTL
jgi:hypothetical protein